MICTREPFFPSFGVDALRHSRGASWMDLLDRIVELPEVHPEVLAFTFMIRRLRRDLGFNGHVHCHTPGCAICAAQILLYFDGSDEELMVRYEASLGEITVALGRIQAREKAA
jgi:hypothetical protein